ncbi:IclR family transcriptional regulator [Bosea sp. NPDC055332]
MARPRRIDSNASRAKGEFTYRNSPMPDDAPTAVKSAERILDLFELLARRSDGLPHMEIAATLEIPKGSLTQLLKTAMGRGYVTYTAADRHYRLGEGLARLARQTSRGQDLIALAQPLLEEITARTRESSALNLLKDGEAEVVATVNGPQRLVSHMRLGDRAPLYATSGGKILLAQMAQAQLEAYFGTVSFEAITPKTLISIEALRRELDEVRRRGIAYSFEEFTPGIIGMAMAVLSSEGEALASLNVALPSIRYNSVTDRLVADALKQAADELGRRIAP